ncbi:peptidylprolyl isomerase [Xanthobacteraceae bacterium Astr-EGSB]|uniref:peptidylprolyl isomerase n=1 Tax=Astrobacterium formosum TaxID=3069710 RepID=UPI0027B3AF96|nr:peptidylprolyl isomerase [Xanthobacteraceae bacterium Astr-EGSB]
MTASLSTASRAAPARRCGLLLAVATTAVVGLAGLAAAQAPDPVVATVNGTEIRQSDINLAAEDIGQNLAQLPEEAKREQLVTYLTDIILLSKAADAKKLADEPDTKRRIAFARNKALMEAMLMGEGKSAVTDQALRAVYQDAIKQMGSDEEVHARHILFRVEKADDKAASDAAEGKVKAVIDRLKKGEDFTTIAKELTEDPSGKKDGGDLGYFTKDQMVPEFAEVAFKLDKGQISEPVKTQFGWHVLKVEDKRKKQPPEFDKVKEQLESFVTRKAQMDLVTKLRADAKVERLDKKADAPAAAPAPAPAPAEPKK